MVGRQYLGWIGFLVLAPCSVATLERLEAFGLEAYLAGKGAIHPGYCELCAGHWDRDGVRQLCGSFGPRHRAHQPAHSTTQHSGQNSITLIMATEAMLWRVECGLVGYLAQATKCYRPLGKRGKSNSGRRPAFTRPSSWGMRLRWSKPLCYLVRQSCRKASLFLARKTTSEEVHCDIF